MDGKAWYPLLGEWGPVGPDYMSQQVYDTTGEFPGEVDPTRFWRTRDGTLIAVEDMTDEHLANALRMLRRRAFELRSKAEPLVEEWRRRGHGEGAWASRRRK